MGLRSLTLALTLLAACGGATPVTDDPAASPDARPAGPTRPAVSSPTAGRSGPAVSSVPERTIVETPGPVESFDSNDPPLGAAIWCETGGDLDELRRRAASDDPADALLGLMAVLAGPWAAEHLCPLHAAPTAEELLSVLEG